MVERMKLREIHHSTEERTITSVIYWYQMSFDKNPFDSRLVGGKVMYELMRRTIRSAVEEFIEKYELNPIDATDIRMRLVERNILRIHVPLNREEEGDAMDWLDDIRADMPKPKS